MAFAAAACGPAVASAPGVRPTAITSSSARSVQPPPVLRVNSDWLTRGIDVSARVGGGPATTFEVDTGSTGVLVSRRLLGPGATPLQPPQTFSGFAYTSSDRSYSGEWMRASLQVGSVVPGGGATVSTSPVLVRAVDTACDAGKHCSAASGVAMLGVGFDRESDRTQQPAPGAGPQLNPFLHLLAMDAGQLTPGYVIGDGTLSLGLDARSTDGFRTAVLAPTSVGGVTDWAAPTGCIAVGASVPAQCGPMLVDTGLGYAIVETATGVQPPLQSHRSPQGRELVQPGQAVTIEVPALGGSQPVYRFGVDGPGAPQDVQWGHDPGAGRAAFMNTSRYLLSGADYLYDAASGRVGFRAR